MLAAGRLSMTSEVFSATFPFDRQLAAFGLRIGALSCAGGSRLGTGLDWRRNQAYARAEYENMVPAHLATACAGASSALHRMRPVMSKAAENEWGAMMAAAQAGNAGAYRRLLGELQGWLNRYYAHRLPSSQVDDAVQDALFAIHQKRHTYDSGRPFRPWLAAVARHKWIDRLRMLGRNAAESLPAEISVSDHESAVTSATVLRQLLAELKPAQADAIRLVKIEGYSVDEAAAETGQSGSLIKVNIHRGLARLSSIVQERSDVE